MNNDVYICYATKDKAVAEKVVSELEARGIKCWIAFRDIKPGMDWGRQILEAIENSRIIVLILSKNSDSSSQMAREIEMAISIGRDVIPFRIEDMNLSGALAYFLSTAHWIDGFPLQLERYFDELIETINIFLGNETKVGIKDYNNRKIIRQSKKQEKKRGLIKRLFRSEEKEEGVSLTIPAEFQQQHETAGEGSFEVVDTLEIQGASTRSVIQFCVGDVTQAAPNQTLDILVTSAQRDLYYPDRGSVFGFLSNKGISVEELANHKEVDLRGAFSCWLSKEILNPPEGVHFKRILCFEPEESAKAGEQIGDIFRSLAPFIGGQDPIRSVGTTLVAAGSSRRITQRESLQLLVEAAVHWISSGLPIEQFKIICLPNQDVNALTKLFAELKIRYASLSPQIGTQFAYDCFISYSHQDTREVELFVDILQDQKKDLRIFIDKHSLDAGSAWQREIYEAIDDCRKVTTFFSPTYLDSKVCLEEFNIALCRHRESEEPILKPIYLYSANLPTYMRLIQYFDCRESNRDKLKEAATYLLESLS
jgi:hypothetical protein